MPHREKTRLLQRCLLQLESISSTMLNHPPALLHYAIPAPLWIEVELFHGSVCQTAGLYNEASLIYSKLRTEHGIDTCVQEVDCLRRTGHTEHARALIEQNLKKNSNQPELVRSLGELCKDIELLEKAFELSGNRDAQCQRSIGKILFDQKRYSGAIDAFEKSLHLNPAQLNVWPSLALAAMRTERWTVAINALEQSCNWDPERYDQWANLALCALKLGQKNRAQRLTKNEAIRLDYDNWRLWENLLALSVDIGKWEDAILSYRRLLELKPRYSDVEFLQLISDRLKLHDKDQKIRAEWIALLKRVSQLSNTDYKVLEILSDWDDRNDEKQNWMQKALAQFLSLYNNNSDWTSEVKRLFTKATGVFKGDRQNVQKLKVKIDLAIALAMKHEDKDAVVKWLEELRENEL
ncbi:hypothetical protein ACOME3_002390 [Neoechinorhynchus agilis]